MTRSKEAGFQVYMYIGSEVYKTVTVYTCIGELERSAVVYYSLLMCNKL